mgnify:CR=1 FL=1
MRKIVLLFFLGLNSLFAQVSSNKVYSLEECLDIASRNNYDIILSGKRTETTGYELTNAFGNYLPSLDFNMGYSRSLNPEGSKSVNVGGIIIQTPGTNPNSYYMQATANWTIFDGFNREARYSSVQNKLDANVESSKYTLQSVKRQIYKQYIDVVKASQIVKIRREDLSTSKKELERIEALYKSGSVPVSEVYSQEAVIGEKEIEIVKAENSHRIAKAMLLTIMGMNPDTDADFKESSIPAFVSDEDISYNRKEIGSLSAAYSTALKARADYKSVNYSLNSAESGIKSAKAGYYPRVSAAGGWNWNHNQFSNFSEYGRSYVSLNLNVPVFSNFSNDYSVQNAQLAYTQTEIEKQKLEHQIRSEVQTAFLNLESAEKQIEISKRSVKSAELNYLSMKERYAVGSASITELTMANTQYITAQINRVAAFYDYIQSLREVQFSLGMLN